MGDPRPRLCKAGLCSAASRAVERTRDRNHRVSCIGLPTSFPELLRTYFFCC